MDRIRNRIATVALAAFAVALGAAVFVWRSHTVADSLRLEAFRSPELDAVLARAQGRLDDLCQSEAWRPQDTSHPEPNVDVGQAGPPGREGFDSDVLDFHKRDPVRAFQFAHDRITAHEMLGSVHCNPGRLVPRLLDIEAVNHACDGVVDYLSQLKDLVDRARADGLARSAEQGLLRRVDDLVLAIRSSDAAILHRQAEVQAVLQSSTTESCFRTLARDALIRRGYPAIVTCCGHEYLASDSQVLAIVSAYKPLYDFARVQCLDMVAKTLVSRGFLAADPAAELVSRLLEDIDSEFRSVEATVSSDLAVFPDTIQTRTR